MAMQLKPQRPNGVAVLAVLEVVGGIVSSVFGFLLIGGAALAAGALALMIGVLGFVLAIGYLGGKGWAWTLGIAVAVINIIILIVEAALGFSANILGIIFAIIIIYYLMRPHVKAYFGKGPAMTPSMQPPPMMSSMPMGSSSTMSSIGMTCKNCGASIPVGATRCPSCGANL